MDTPEKGFGTPDADGLEARLARQSLRTVPASWRAEILAQAQSETVIGLPRIPRTRPRREGPGWLEELLRRFPIAWAGFAALWLFIFVADSTDRWLNGTTAVAPRVVSAEQIAAARAQRAELWSLAGLDRPTAHEPDADRPRDSVLRPRSSLRQSGLNFGALERTESELSA